MPLRQQIAGNSNSFNNEALAIVETKLGDEQGSPRIFVTLTLEFAFSTHQTPPLVARLVSS